MNAKSKDGRETWRRLRDWDRGQAAAERLSGHVLRAEGYQAVDPSHPLGGPDGLKDVKCERGGHKWIGAAYFPRGQQTWVAIKRKFSADFKGVAKNKVHGIAFITNQELSLNERNELIKAASGAAVDILHLERIASRLDAADCYGLRLEFLDIEMSKEEQLAFLASRDLLLTQMHETIKALASSSVNTARQPKQSVPHVTPRDLGGFGYTTSSLFQSVPHECSQCKGVFIVDPLWSATTITVGSYSPFGGMRTITCPYCGRAERYTGL